MYDDLPLTSCAIRITVAVLLGGCIGFERKSKPAGFRTHSMVCLGSTLFMLASILMADQARNAGQLNVDPTRIASTIVQGVGFVAAGVIFAARQRVRGLTTAASVWATAAIGMLVGAGFIAVAVMGTVAILIVLAVFDMLEDRLPGGSNRRSRGDVDEV